MNLGVYILKRLLALIPTLIGISALVFFMVYLAPGGPVEQAIANMRFSAEMAGDTSGGSVGSNLDSGVSEEVIESLKRQYGWDKPPPLAYLSWLGKVVQGDFGKSFSYKKPALDVIIEKIPISATFGIVSFLLSYLICIPLGIFKAIKDGSVFDSVTSAIIFVTYSIPAFVVGILLIVWLGPGGADLFPVGGIKSELFDEMGPMEQFYDLASHFTLPLVCFVIGSFAVTTVLMKNSMLDEIKKDYVRTAKSKGLSFFKVTFKHVLRNALIPICVGFSSVLRIFFTGSILLETIFDIPGIGLLSFTSTLQRDINVIMALLMITSTAGLLSILLSDIILAFVDPRIDFSKKT